MLERIREALRNDGEAPPHDGGPDDGAFGRNDDQEQVDQDEILARMLDAELNHQTDESDDER